MNAEQFDATHADILPQFNPLQTAYAALPSYFFRVYPKMFPESAGKMGNVLVSGKKCNLRYSLAVQYQIHRHLHFNFMQITKYRGSEYLLEMSFQVGVIGAYLVRKINE